MWVSIPDPDNPDGHAKLIATLEDAGFTELVKRIQAAEAELADPVRSAYRDAVPVSEGDLEVDSDAVVSIGEDPGAYVQTWKWVPNEALPEDLRPEK